MTLIVKVSYSDGLLFAADGRGTTVEAGSGPGAAISEKWYTDPRGFIAVAAGENNFSRTVFGKLRADTSVTSTNVFQKAADIAKGLAESQDQSWGANFNYVFYIASFNNGNISARRITYNYADPIDVTDKFYTEGAGTSLFPQIATLKIRHNVLDKNGGISLALALIDLVADDTTRVGEVKKFGANVIGLKLDGTVWEKHISRGPIQPSIFVTLAELINCDMVEVPR